MRARAGLPDAQLVRVYALFPMLAELRHLVAGGLSGGQQQMRAVGCALMANPCPLLPDEPSMGVPPILVDQILAVPCRLRRDGTTVVLSSRTPARR